MARTDAGPALPFSDGTAPILAFCGPAAQTRGVCSASLWFLLGQREQCCRRLHRTGVCATCCVLLLCRRHPAQMFVSMLKGLGIHTKAVCSFQPRQLKARSLQRRGACMRRACAPKASAFSGQLRCNPDRCACPLHC